MEQNLYHYKAHITKVYDGDTVTADIDLGFNMVMRKQKLRLLGIDTPEIRGEEREKGLISRDRLSELILDTDVCIVTDKDKSGKYGRWLVTIYADTKTDDGWINCNQLLLNENLAKVYT
jgi:micrococcal nuclease